MGLGNSTELQSLQRRHDTEKRTLPTAALTVHTVLNEMNAKDGERALELLSTSSSSSSSSVYIDLSNCGITNEGIRSHARSIQAAFKKNKKNTNMTTMNMKRDEESQQNMNPSGSVRSLNLSYNQLTDASVVFLLEKGASCGVWNRLRSLTLSGNRIHSKSCAAIATHLLLLLPLPVQGSSESSSSSSSSSLRSLILFNCDLCDEDVKPIFDALQRSTTALRELNIAMNPRLTSRTLLMCLKAIDVDYGDLIGEDRDDNNIINNNNIILQEGQGEDMENLGEEDAEEAMGKLGDKNLVMTSVNETLAVFRCDVGETTGDEDDEGESMYNNNNNNNNNNSRNANMKGRDGADIGALLSIHAGKIGSKKETSTSGQNVQQQKRGKKNLKRNTKENSAASIVLSLRSRIDSILQTRVAAWELERERIRNEEIQEGKQMEGDGTSLRGTWMNSTNNTSGGSKRKNNENTYRNGGLDSSKEYMGVSTEKRTDGEMRQDGGEEVEAEAYHGLPTSASHVVQHLYATGTYGSNTLHPLNPANEKSASPSSSLGVNGMLTVEALEMFVDPLLPQKDRRTNSVLYNNSTRSTGERDDSNEHHNGRQRRSHDGSYTNSINTRNNSALILPSIDSRKGSKGRLMVKNPSFATTTATATAASSSNMKKHRGSTHNDNSVASTSNNMFSYRRRTVRQTEEEARRWRDARVEKGALTRTTYNGFTPFHLDVSPSHATSMKGKTAADNSSAMRTLAANSSSSGNRPEAYYVEAPQALAPCWCIHCSGETRRRAARNEDASTKSGANPVAYKGLDMEGGQLHYHCRYEEQRYRLNRGEAVQAAAAAVSGTRAAVTSPAAEDGDASLKKKYTQGCRGTGHRCVSSHLSASALPDHSAAHFFSSPSVSTARGLQFM